MDKYKILLVDDDEDNLTSTKDLLRIWGYDVDAVAHPSEALKLIQAGAKEYAVGLLDYKMPGLTGVELAKQIRQTNFEVVLLVYSAHPSVESLKLSIRAGILNFIEKDEDITTLKIAVENACKEFEKLRTTKPSLSQEESSKLIATLGMVGKSQQLAHVAHQVQIYRSSKKPVLILGETGVGKEMIAKALHTGPAKSFFVINCAAFYGSTLVESELFGYEKGAFTGANTRKIGILEAARGGTVFLDELHHLDLPTQGKLFRALREKMIRRVGGHTEEPVDFRLITSCRPDIEERVRTGQIQPDLYFRLNVHRIEIPPLRERTEDIEPLISYYCDKYFQETGKRKKFLMRTIKLLEKYPWPGNVGELDAFVANTLTETTKDTIDESAIDPKLLQKGYGLSGEATYAQLESRQQKEKKQFIAKALQSSHSVLQAAQKIGMKSSSLHTLMTRLGIREDKGTKHESKNCE